MDYRYAKEEYISEICHPIISCNACGAKGAKRFNFFLRHTGLSGHVSTRLISVGILSEGCRDDIDCCDCQYKNSHHNHYAETRELINIHTYNQWRDRFKDIEQFASSFTSSNSWMIILASSKFLNLFSPPPKRGIISPFPVFCGAFSTPMCDRLLQSNS